MNSNSTRHLVALCVLASLVLIGLPAHAQGYCSVTSGDCGDSDDCTGEENVCVICGDGERVPGFEECDDGNTENGDGCTSECEIDPVCGDADVDPGEQCDNGAANSDSAADACRTDCRVPWCGDEVRDNGGPSWLRELCDDGSRNSDFEPNACRMNCLRPYCGDGIVDGGIGLDLTVYREECDLGPENSDLPGAICSTECRLRGCGNGLLEVGELCDDGNTSDADGCTSQCRWNVCGDGYIWASVEMCEYDSPWSRGECRYDCGQNISLCGNGAVEAGEGCDAGGDRNNDEANNPCRTDCQPMRCGDGVVDAGEACDLEEGCAPDCSWIAAR